MTSSIWTYPCLCSACLTPMVTKFSPLKSFQLVCRASDISGRFARCTPLTTELHHRLLTQEQHLHYLSSSSYDLSFSSFFISTASPKDYYRNASFDHTNPKPRLITVNHSILLHL